MVFRLDVSQYYLYNLESRQNKKAEVEKGKVGSKSLSGAISKFAKPATSLLSVPIGPLRAVKIRPTSNLINPKRI